MGADDEQVRAALVDQPVQVRRRVDLGDLDLLGARQRLGERYGIPATVDGDEDAAERGVPQAVSEAGVLRTSVASCRVTDR